MTAAQFGWVGRGAAGGLGPVEAAWPADAQAAARLWPRLLGRAPAGLLLQPPDAAALQAWADWATPALAAVCAARPTVLLCPPDAPGGARAADLARDEALAALGLQAVLPDGLPPAALAASLGFAIVRHRLDRPLRQLAPLDAATGLPSRAQLVPQIQQMLALREREPAPMALLLIELPELAELRERLGEGATALLRRKLAVRMRAKLRGSDVVAVDGPTRLAVWLARLDQPASAGIVADKLIEALARPLQLGEAEGLRVHPRIGFVVSGPGMLDAEHLWQRALAALDGAAPLGSKVFFVPAEGRADAAANDPGDPAG